MDRIPRDLDEDSLDETARENSVAGRACLLGVSAHQQEIVLSEEFGRRNCVCVTSDC